MKRSSSSSTRSPSQRQSRSGYQRAGLFVGFVALGVLTALASYGFIRNTQTLAEASRSPVDAYLMLGGSIRREIYMAEVVRRESPQNIPILISQGSQDPCIVLIFQRALASMSNVWLEKCANSTFGNFYYALPILQQWGVQKLKLVTSGSHQKRALWLGQIMLGSHGIWVELEAVSEKGVPANRESRLKTTLDITRALGWAIISQFRTPSCHAVIPLDDVNLAQWRERGFSCEHQGNLQ
uniref:Uncharacterized protein n=2 Tax=Desertifilum TaxID=1185872 RepID=A0A1E5QL69_9CYAN|nr:hypothetical protein BH720_10130 [Desertifilum tharense IPPAS B-1220]